MNLKKAGEVLALYMFFSCQLLLAVVTDRHTADLVLCHDQKLATMIEYTFYGIMINCSSCKNQI